MKSIVIVKASMTLDGKIASRTGDAKWISCEKARTYNHKFRTQIDGILAGINTILSGNPGLTSHGFGKNPSRIILDSSLKIPLDSKVLDEEANTIIFYRENLESKKIPILKEKNIILIPLSKKNGSFDFTQIIKVLNEMSLFKLLIEGGGETIFRALQARVVDEVLFSISPKIIGGRDAKTPVEGDGIKIMDNAIEVEDWTWETVGVDLMIRGKIKKI